MYIHMEEDCSMRTTKKRKSTGITRHLQGIGMLSLALFATLSCMFFPEGIKAEEEIYYSGPITVSREEESAKIQRAPAYNKEWARAYFPMLPIIRQNLDPIASEDICVLFGQKQPSEAAKEALVNAITTLKQDNHFVSFMMVDANSLSGVAYNADSPFCTQSTIKAIYVGTLLENHPEALQENGQYMHDAIVYSDNDAYESLRTIYGDDDLHRWFRETGVEEYKADPLYPRNVTVKEMVKLWTRLYEVLNGEDPENFAAYYADSLASATSAVLGEIYPVQTKAGWETGIYSDFPYFDPAEIEERFLDKDPSNDECSINDTGIVYTTNGPYFFAIFTDYPYDIYPNLANPLEGLARTLLDVQRSYYE